MAIVGMIFSRIVLTRLIHDYTDVHFVLGILLVFPMAIDGILQYRYMVMSTNPRRAITGLLFGIGAFLLVRYVRGNYSHLIGEADMVVTVVLQIIGHLVTFIGLKLEFRKTLKEKLSDEQRQVYAETFSVLERLSHDADLCYDSEYINEINMCRCKVLLAASGNTFRCFERIYNSIIERYEGYSEFCECNDPLRNKNNIECIEDDNGITQEILHVSDNDIEKYESACMLYKKDHQIDEYKRQLTVLLNSMRKDLENEQYQVLI